MARKVLVPLYGEDVAPRFDLATEALIADLDAPGGPQEDRTVVLPQASAEDLCHLVLTEGIGTVVCGGIEEEYYQYLRWKKVTVLDSVIGPAHEALERLKDGELESGDILIERGEAVP
jgi:predicted Fe-Mo cluster-binding NifX family protein